MKLNNLTIGYGLAGSFCTFDKSIEALKTIVNMGNNVIPIVSETVASTDTRFGKSEDILRKLEYITSNEVVTDIVGAEVFGPKIKLDLLVIAPCTSNSLAKFVNAVADTSITMAMKAHLRRQSAPLVIAFSSNDGLGNSLKNIGAALNLKHVFMVPMIEDDVIAKPNSLVADYGRLVETCQLALEDKQLRNIFN